MMKGRTVKHIANRVLGFGNTHHSTEIASVIEASRNTGPQAGLANILF